MGILFCGAAPAPAQVANTGPSTTSRTDIVVNAKVAEKASRWKRAETDHIVMYSTGSDDTLKRVIMNLEALHGLMSRLYVHGPKSEDPARMTITLLDSDAQFLDLGLQNMRSQEGPFGKAFATQRYFDFGVEGDVLAIARTDQTIKLDTNRRFNLDCDDYYSSGGGDLCGAVRSPGLASSGVHMAGVNVGRVPPAIKSWESQLYSSYAQHFLLTYLPAAYPRWYLDGIGAFFSTIAVEPDGAMDYGRPPSNYRNVFRSYGYPKVGDILTGRYLDADAKTASWSPYAAWLLGHYFIYANLKPDVRTQFEEYMASVRRGTPMADAAATFRDMRKLQRDIVSYADSRIAFAHAEPPQLPIDPPLITTLSPAEGDFVEEKVEIESRLASAPIGSDPGATAAQSTAWVAHLSGKVASLPYNPDALLLAAEAECRSGKADDCLASAERLLSTSPDNVRALAWKGIALTGQAMDLPPENRSTRLADARTSIARAIQLDGQDPLAQIAYFQSFAKAGQPVPETAMRGIALAIRNAPAAPAPRLYLARELVREGHIDLARRLLFPVLHGAYESPEKTAAQSLLAPFDHQLSERSGISATPSR